MFILLSFGSKDCPHPRQNQNYVQWLLRRKIDGNYESFVMKIKATSNVSDRI
jgi:hypothetical protein